MQNRGSSYLRRDWRKRGSNFQPHWRRMCPGEPGALIAHAGFWGVGRRLPIPTGPRDKADYEELDRDWREASREHAGVLRCRELEVGYCFTLLERAARLLSGKSRARAILLLLLMAICAGGFRRSYC